MSESPLLAAALRYAASGVAVFPSRLYVRGDGRKGVNPISDWDEASSTDPEVIRGWFTGAWRDAALCIDCGKSGIVGVDQDVAEGKNGIEEWSALEHEQTWTVRSPSGGRHDYYRADPEHPFTVDNTGAVADGVDIRGMGGFLFAPPTVDPRGGSWQWENSEPDWAALPMVPEVVIKRMEQAAARKRPKVSVGTPPPLTSISAPPRDPAESASQLFASPSELADFGPGAGRKKASAAGALLMEELRKFTELTEEGNGRSHILAQKLGVLAGHGVGVFWTYEGALEALMTACAANGFSLANGENYAREQAQRGLEYGMRELWVPEPESVTPAEVVVTGDEVDALISEMLNADQMQSRPVPQYLIKGILNLDSEAWTIGEPGCKKSFVVLDQATHIVRGMPWRGLKVTQGPVVMIVAEGAGGMSTRIKAWQQEYGRIGDDLYMLPRPVQASDARAWRVLAEACLRLRAVMVVIDTQARVTVGLKENDATDMGVYIQAVSIMRQLTSACVHTIHHTGRNGGDARGSSAIDGAQGTELKVIRTGPYSGTLHVEKQKDMEEAPDISLHFKKVTVGVDEDGDDITSLVLIESNAFMDAAGSEAPIERGQEIALPEPEPWTMRVYDHNRGENVRRILTIVQHLAGEHGLTETKVQRALLSRWYDGLPMKAKKAGHLDPETWAGSWTRALDLRSASGERIIEQIEGAARYWIHPDILSSLG